MTIKPQRGFTLIEVLIALSILVGGMMMISMAWSGNFLKMRKSTLAYDVATLLERKMVETEAKYQDKFGDLQDDSTEKGDFGDDHPQYRWEMKVHKMKFPDITPLLTGQENGASEGLISVIKQMTDFIDQSVKEVKVTIFVKTGHGKEMEYAASQYFVDYSQQFGLGGGAGGGATTGNGTQNGSNSTTPANGGK